MRFDFEARTRELLRGIRALGSVSAAAAGVGMDAANALRHLRTAERRAGVRLVERRRGGRGGNAALTAAGRRRLGAGGLVGVAFAFDAENGTTPIRVGGRVLHAAGAVAPGPVEVAIPAEAVGLERAPASAPSSVRNRFPARVSALEEEEADGVHRVGLVCGSLRLESLVVRGSVRELRLRVGSRVWATVKASSLRVSPLG